MIFLAVLAVYLFIAMFVFCRSMFRYNYLRTIQGASSTEREEYKEKARKKAERLWATPRYQDEKYVELMQAFDRKHNGPSIYSVVPLNLALAAIWPVGIPVYMSMQMGKNLATNEQAEKKAQEDFLSGKTAAQLKDLTNQLEEATAPLAIEAPKIDLAQMILHDAKPSFDELQTLADGREMHIIRDGAGRMLDVFTVPEPDGFRATNIFDKPKKAQPPDSDPLKDIRKHTPGRKSDVLYTDKTCGCVACQKDIAEDFALNKGTTDGILTTKKSWV